MHRACLIACLLLCAPCCALAGAVQLYLMDVPPMSTQAGPGHGVVGDIVLEALRRAGIAPQLQFVPNNRAIVVAQLPSSQSVLIIPLARVPEREAHFTWIAPLYKVERAFFTTGKQIDSYAEARRALHTIGVARGTVTPVILHAQGFAAAQIYQISDNDNVQRMLEAGRMDAWFGPIEQMRVFLHKHPTGRIVEGRPVNSTDNYLACSRKCDPALVARLTRQLAAMERDGTIRAIRARYARAGR